MERDAQSYGLMTETPLIITFGQHVRSRSCELFATQKPPSIELTASVCLPKRVSQNIASTPILGSILMALAVYYCLPSWVESLVSAMMAALSSSLSGLVRSQILVPWLLVFLVADIALTSPCSLGPTTLVNRK